MQGYLFARPMTAEALAAWQQLRVAESLEQRAAGIENRLRMG